MMFDDAENHTSESHGPRTLLMAPAQQEETISPRENAVMDKGQKGDGITKR